MNILSKVTRRFLTRNKTRTVVTIIGIILSTAMLTAVTTAVSSVQQYVIDVLRITNGDWFINIADADSEILTTLQNDDEVTKVGYYANIGHSLTPEGATDRLFLKILGFDESMYDIYQIDIIEGRRPVNDSELLISERILQGNNSIYTIGNVVTLNVGTLTLQDTEDYENDVELSTYIDNPTAKQYTIVGICERPMIDTYSSNSYVTITGLPQDVQSSLTAYVTLDDPSDVYDYRDAVLSEYECTYNRDLLLYMGSSNNTVSITLVSLAAILIFIIMAASILLIYNAFSISVSERTRQFGLLSSIGATRRQLRRTVIYEALTVSSIGIPIGIISGITGIGVTMYLMRNSFNSAFGVEGDISLKLYVSWISVAIAAVIALITVLISAYIPSKRASRMNAIDAIRQSGDIKIEKRVTRKMSFTYKLFGLEGLIARKNFRRQKKRYRTTVVSLFVSIVLFVTASTFAQHWIGSYETHYRNSPYDLRFTRQYTMTIEDFDNYCTQFEHLATVSSSTETLVYKGIFTEDPFNSNYQNGSELISTTCIGLDDALFDEYAAKQGFNKADYYDKANVRGIIYDKVYLSAEDRRADKLTSVFSELPEYIESCIPLTGTTFSLPMRPQSERAQALEQLTAELIVTCTMEEALHYINIECGDRAKELPSDVEDIINGEAVYVIMPLSVIRAQTDIIEYNEDDRPSMPVYNFAYYTADNHEDTAREMKKILTLGSHSSSAIYDAAEGEAASRGLIMIVQVFSYGFIALMALITVANVFNTISTNMQLRKREMAMLRSIGMTQKGFRHMFNYECLLYGVKSLVLGVPVSLLFSFLIYMSLLVSLDISYIFPWQAILISVACVFLVVSITMTYSMVKLNRQNTIDVLRNENI